MKIRKATAGFEAWLARHLTIVEPDLELKHKRMREGAFLFLRATFYRWAQIWPELCPDLASAPAVLAVGDLHVDNFGTWRDTEGRLVWGINDFDEAWRLPYTNDLVRLATSVNLAIRENRLAIGRQAASQAILEGYSKALEAGGRPVVLAEEHPALRAMAIYRLKDPGPFWQKLEAPVPIEMSAVPAGALKGIRRMLPEPDLPLTSLKLTHRVAGMGSLGRERFVAVADWEGGNIAREAKAMAPSACAWALGEEGSRAILYQTILDRSVRSRDPYVRLKGRWIVRRLAPDCTRIELSALPAQRDEIRLLHAMGWDTANVHLGTLQARAIRRDLARRPANWLFRASERMAQAVIKDWELWRAS
jgi:Uncharacterized protein conserved in bacteria (DUF2252)